MFIGFFECYLWNGKGRGEKDVDIRNGVVNLNKKLVVFYCGVFLFFSYYFVIR